MASSLQNQALKTKADKKTEKLDQIVYKLRVRDYLVLISEIQMILSINYCKYVKSNKTINTQMINVDKLIDVVEKLSFVKD